MSVHEPFIKTIEPAKQFTAEPVASLVDVGYRGVDWSWMQKRAAANVFSHIDLKPRKGRSYVHLIAMGDSDVYGMNANGDIFYKQARYVDIPEPEKGTPSRRWIPNGNVERHHTFEKYAKVYRHHCFTAGTQVLSGEFSYKPIEEFVEGDSVVSHTGRVRRVVRCFKEKAPETVYRMAVKGTQTPAHVTGEHPVLVVRRDQTLCEKRGMCGSTGNKCYPSTQGQQAICVERGCTRPERVQHWTPEWMPVKYVRHGDFVCFPTGFEADEASSLSELSCGDAYILGLVFAEGHYVKAEKRSYELSITIGEHEEALREAVESYLDSNNLAYRGPYRHKDNHTLCFQIKGKAFRSRCEALLGGVTYSSQRRAGSVLLTAPEDVRKAFLAGVLDGDGHFHTRNKMMRIRSTSFEGLGDLVRLAHSVGIPAVAGCDGRGGYLYGKGRYAGRVYTAKPSGVAAMPFASVELLRPFSLKLEDAPAATRGGSTSSFFIDGFVCFPVTRVEAVAADSVPGFDGFVYNLEVEEDNSYLVNGWAVHNCNKPSDPHYGEVKHSAHNDDMSRVELIVDLPDDQWEKQLHKLASGEDVEFSMSTTVPGDLCMAPDTKVRTSRGLVALENVSVGDRVQTHTGAFRRVTRVFSRAAESLLSLSVFGVSSALCMTPNHPILLVKESALRACWGSAGGKRRRHTLAENGSSCVTCGTSVALSPAWVDASAADVGDYMLAPVSRPGAVAVNLAEAYCSGFYAGDGSPIRQMSGRKKSKPPYKLMGVEFSLDRTDEEVCSMLCAQVSSVVGRDVRVKPDKRNNGGTVSMYHQVVGKRIVGLCGEGSRTKRIDERVFSWTSEARKAFLGGCLDSDGSVDSAKGSGRYCTSSPDLADAVWRLVIGLGIPASVHHETVHSEWAAGGACPVYVVYIPPAGVYTLSEYSARAARNGKRAKTKSSIVFYENYALFPITEISEAPGGPVCNLSVEGDESYVAGGLATHNCSYCGHFAPSRKHYCDHAKKAMTQMLKSGHQVGVINYDMNFFDISEVVRRADRIALGLLKAASQDPDTGELKEAARFIVPTELLPHELRVNEPQLRKLSEIEKLVSVGFSGLPGKLCGKPEDMPDGQVEDLRKAGSLPGVLAAAADEGICLPMVPFFKLALGHSYKRVEPYIKEAQAALPGVFTRMLDDRDMDCSDFMLNDRPISGAGYCTVLGAKKAHSLFAADAVARAAMAAIRGDEVHVKRAHAAPTEAGDRLARLYGKYKVAFLARVGKGVNSDNLLTELLVLPHYL